MHNLQKAGGVAALLEAAIYVSAFIFFGAFWDFPVGGDAATKFAFLAENQIAFSIANFIMYVLFGIVLTVLVLAIHERLKQRTPNLSQISAVFGLLWVGLVIASGMISNIGLASVLELAEKSPDEAMVIWTAVYTIVEGIGGGNEIVGGLWVLLLSVAALQAKAFSKPLNYLGVFVGIAGICTSYPAEIITEIFGVSQIIWFSYLGVSMLRNSAIETEKQLSE